REDRRGGPPGAARVECEPHPVRRAEQHRGRVARPRRHRSRTRRRALRRTALDRHPGAPVTPPPASDECEALVSAADIPRLTGLGRAAVSNCRRRYDDFPKPVDGSANSPSFALRDVEKWPADQGKPLTRTPEERLWQLLRATAGDLRLGEVVGELGARVFIGETDAVDEGRS